MATNGVDMRRDIESQLAKLSLAREARLRDQLEALQKQYAAAAKELRGQEELQRLSGQFVAALDAALRELAEQTGQQMLHAIQIVIGNLADDTEFAESVRLLGTVTESPELDYGDAEQHKLTSMEMFTAVTPVLSIDRLVTFLPSVLGVPALAAGPIGLVAAGIGAAVAMVLARERKKIAAHNSFTQWVVAVINGARNEDRLAFGTAMVDARSHIAKALDDAIKRRTSEIAGERARLDKALSESEAQRARARQAATAKVTAIDTLVKRLHETYLAVNDQRARTAPKPEPEKTTVAPGGVV
jgi:ADP-ribose pyrophosphatase YjhB (NUDIX family)